MSAQEKKEGAGLTLVEAVETLSKIADLEYDQHVGIAKEHNLVIKDTPLSFRTVHWLHHKDTDETVADVKETFRVILNYLRNFYEEEYGYIYNPETIERIKTIMVLVGEAAKKLDKYTTLFHKTHFKSVTQLKEYKKLQEFYVDRISRKVDEGTLGKWILALSKKVGTPKEARSAEKTGGQSKHLFIDLESVKKDAEYELFYLKKEDGARFFSPRLIRNIKLISDFGVYFGEEREEDPVGLMNIWQDRMAHACARDIIRTTTKSIERFYADSIHATDYELVDLVNKSLMALMLAANPHNLFHNLPLKNCYDYFHDFQQFLRDVLHSADYQRLIAYPPSKSNIIENSLLNTIHAICLAIYTQLGGDREMLSMIHGLIEHAEELVSVDHQKATKSSKTIWSRLAGDYAAMTKLMKLHPNGPLDKILESLEEGQYKEFDPLMAQNLPLRLFALYVQDYRCQFSRWPTQTYQEFIHKATVTDEFKGFLRGCSHDPHVHKSLVFNLQDRSSWKEHSRCYAIEDLPNHETYAKYISVATLAKDTEFYNQLAPYHQLNQTAVFIKNFKEQLLDENCGFMFPDEIKKRSLTHFIDEAMTAILRIFFSNKNVLMREHRMDFIEIFYFFLQLKILDIVKPDVVGFTCKDCVDISSSAGAELFIFLKLLNQERLSENDREHLDLMLYGPGLLFRERLMMPERFNRMISAVKAIETVREQMGYSNFVKAINEAFGKLYSIPLLQAKAVIE